MANGGFIGVDRTPFAGTLISDFTGSGTFNRSATTGTVLVVAGGAQGGSSIAGGGGGGMEMVTTWIIFGIQKLTLGRKHNG